MEIRYFSDFNKQSAIKRLFIGMILKYWDSQFDQIQESSKFKFISYLRNKLDTIFFNYRTAPVLVNKDDYLKFEKHPIREFKYGFYTVPGIVFQSGEKIKSSVYLKRGMTIFGGVSILDKVIKSIHSYNLTITVGVSNAYIGNKVYKFTIPVHRSKTLLKSVGTYFRNGEFVEFYIDVDKLALPEDDYSFEISGDYTSIKAENVSNIKLPGILLKSPQIVKKKSRSDSRHIIVLGLESLTDPFWLMQKCNHNQLLPGFDQVIKDGVHYTNSYSQQDGTLPFMASSMTGLYSSQHLLGDYEKPIYQHQIPNNFGSLSSILKAQGFLTDAMTPVARWDTSYGWARGYDSFRVAPTAWEEEAPNSGNITRMISKDTEYDTFKFIHIDRVHLPILKFVSSQSPQVFDIESLDSAESHNFYPILFDQIQKIDKIIYDIIQTLKYESVYDNTLIILAGDHGIAVPPKWKNGLQYALYEEHIRVPYIVKWPNWYPRGAAGISTNKPHNATVDIYKDVLKSLKMTPPDHHLNLPQNDPKYDGYAFTETIYHPKNENYAISVISDEFKYWMLCKMDWKKWKFIEKVEEKLFSKDDDGMFDETVELGDNFHSEKSQMNNLAMDFLNENLQFNKNMST